jgi:hypothetical protein
MLRMLSNKQFFFIFKNKISHIIIIVIIYNVIINKTKTGWTPLNI